MPPKENYQLTLDRTLQTLEGRPRLLLHACCAPCSSYVLEYLSQYFEITLFYYNPNISPQAEYEKRLAEVKRLLKELPLASPAAFAEGAYDPERFFERSKGLEALPEGGERCLSCFRLRLEEAARAAKAGGFQYFTTTLSISPHKDAQALNEIGGALAARYGVPYLHSDFKKRGGYGRSIALSREYGLYRQPYCGCVFSQREAAKKTSEFS